jgi:diaminopimelate epimerase
MPEFHKMNGLGNDFIIIFAEEIPDLKQIIKICDRKIGVGCDQLILLSNVVDCDIAMKIFNADGTQAGACGNATRCVAWLIANKISKKNISIKTQDRILHAQISDESIAVEMGRAQIKNTDYKLPSDFLKYELIAYADIGNPHIIILLNEVDMDIVRKFGQSISQDKFFKKGVNVNFCSITDKNNIELVTWERGAGLTLACGTGACATSSVLYHNNMIDNQVKVQMLGGVLDITIDKNLNVIMQGKVQYEFQGEFIW